MAGCNGKTAAFAMRSSSARKAGGVETSKSKWGHVEPTARNGFTRIDGIGSPQYNAFKAAVAAEKKADAAYSRVSHWSDIDPRSNASYYPSGKPSKRDMYQYRERKRRSDEYEKAYRAREKAEKAFFKAFPDSDYPFK